MRWLQGGGCGWPWALLARCTCCLAGWQVRPCCGERCRRSGKSRAAQSASCRGQAPAVYPLHQPQSSHVLPLRQPSWMVPHPRPSSTSPLPHPIPGRSLWIRFFRARPCFLSSTTLKSGKVRTDAKRLFARRLTYMRLQAAPTRSGHTAACAELSSIFPPTRTRLDCMAASDGWGAKC